ncbi:hypothetical protein GCM10022222_65940 [Amycolatopsis ultiminotia]|uniref:FXSXX-COOH protein n=1 Tax=Amycolatopsis ultiminotia TaxID=543629 RepID=A0ABP6XUQ3_9PSEU
MAAAPYPVPITTAGEYSGNGVAARAEFAEILVNPNVAAVFNAARPRNRRRLREGMNGNPDYGFAG